MGKSEQKVLLDKGLVIDNRVVLGFLWEDTLIRQYQNYNTRIFGYWYFKDENWLNSMFDFRLKCYATNKNLSDSFVYRVDLSDLKDVKNYDCISETIINKYIMKINIITNKSYQLLSRKEFISKIKQCLSKPDYDIYYRNMLLYAFETFYTYVNRPSECEQLRKKISKLLGSIPEYGIYVEKEWFGNKYAYVTEEDVTRGQDKIMKYEREAEDIYEELYEEFNRYLWASCKRYD